MLIKLHLVYTNHLSATNNQINIASQQYFPINITFQKSLNC